MVDITPPRKDVMILINIDASAVPYLFYITMAIIALGMYFLVWTGQQDAKNKHNR